MSTVLCTPHSLLCLGGVIRFTGLRHRCSLHVQLLTFTHILFIFLLIEIINQVFESPIKQNIPFEALLCGEPCIWVRRVPLFLPISPSIHTFIFIRLVFEILLCARFLCCLFWPVGGTRSISAYLTRLFWLRELSRGFS